MLYLQQLILFAFSLLLLCSATKHRQRAQHTAAESEGFLNAPIPRMWDESSPPVSDTSSESPLAAIKRTLLGARQSSCDPGYALCDASQRCCPNSGNGECCHDGTCVTTDQTCCSNGGACDTGLKCCGTSSCAPIGGECCNDGRFCDPGLHCVILNGVQGCCEDLSCTEFGSGGAAPTLPSFTFTPISITPISFTPISVTLPNVPSITGGDYSYFTTTWTWYYYTYFWTTVPPSFTGPTSTKVTTSIELSAYATDTVDASSQFESITAAATTDYSYFTTTWTWYYYTYFLTTVPPSFTSPTSTEVTTRTTLSVYATDAAEADSQFEDITAAAAVPTAITAPGFTSDVAALTATRSSTSAPKAGGAGANTASSGSSVVAASGSMKIDGSLEMLLLGSCLGIGIGLLAVWL